MAIGEKVGQAPTTDSIEQLLNDAQRAANQLVERAELEALTIRRLMRIEAERLAASVERLKERAAVLDEQLQPGQMERQTLPSDRES